MTTQDLMTIIGMNIALLGAFSAMVYWMINKIDSDVKALGTDLKTDIKALSSRLDGHAMRIDQLYKMFIDLLKERK